LLLDVQARDWSPEILEALDIPAEWLPPTHEGPEVTGRVSAEAAEATGLEPGTPVVGGGVAPVGGVGIANVMVISVLERRGEIGLRRALGATRLHVAVQFLGEALLLSAIGGAGGIALGVVVTAIYATIKGWATLVPPVAMISGFGAALLIGESPGCNRR
jgi:putative ABC transport system permease protein